MIPMILPKVKIVAKIPRGARFTVKSLCRDAGIECKVTGSSALREIHLLTTSELEASREPGPSGSVAVGLPAGSLADRAVLALGVLAYAVLDYASRESVRGLPIMRSSPPRGRPRKAHALSGTERQRRWRARP